MFCCAPIDHYFNIELKDILQLRSNPNKAYTFFYDCVLRCVVGKTEWKRMIKLQKPIKDTVSVSDEAYALLLLENGWEKWSAIVRDNITCAKQLRAMKSVYTRVEREGNTVFDGWSYTGLQQYNNYCYKIIKDRQTHESFDQDYITEFLQMNYPDNLNKTTAENNNKATNDLAARQAFVPFNEFQESETAFVARHKILLDATNRSLSSSDTREGSAISQMTKVVDKVVHTTDFVTNNIIASDKGKIGAPNKILKKQASKGKPKKQANQALNLRSNSQQTRSQANHKRRRIEAPVPFV